MRRRPEGRETTEPHESDTAPKCARLDEIMLSVEEARSPAPLIGFFAGISSARRPVPESVWFPMLFDGRRLGEDVAKSMLADLMRLYDVVDEEMADDPAGCVPPAWTEERRQWCDGFVRGMHLCGEPPPDQLSIASVVVHMDVLGGGFPFEELYRHEDHKRSEEEWRKSIEEILPEAIVGLRYELAVLALSEALSAKALKPPTRNSPCPCGSGKKYERCCGAA